MSELISRSAIKYEQWSVGPLCEPLMVVRKKTIDSIPAVDAVEVVRCIECEEFEPNEIVAPQTGTCWHCEMVRDFDSFCSYGKRRMDGE